MPKKALTILGINPGSRYMGFAVFQQAELRDWGVKVVEGKWSKQKVEKMKEIVSNMIQEYDINVLAIKKLNPSRSSKNLNKLAEKIKEYSKKHNIKVYQYSIDQLEKSISPEAKINKREMAEMLATDYPVLFHDWEKEKKYKNPYYIRMFEAVALGSVCFSQLDKSY